MNIDRTEDAACFLREVRGLPFRLVGAYALIRAHMLLTPDHAMTRPGIHAALRTRSPDAVSLIDAAINELFDEEADGAVVFRGTDVDHLPQ